MLVITKGLLSGYKINPSTIYEARNAKVLCLFENSALSGLLCLYNIVFFFDHSTPTMAVANNAAGELVPDMVER